NALYDRPVHASSSCVVALAGRRIDKPNATPVRFDLAAVSVVRARVREYLGSIPAVALVSSAACGADLIALEEAGKLGVRRRIILPFDAVRFRGTSVTDRPGGWGPLYDRIVEDVRRSDDLVILDAAADDMTAYAAATVGIFDEALALAADAEVIAMGVWDAHRREADDMTAAFKAEGERRGIKVIEVSTLE